MAGIQAPNVRAAPVPKSFDSVAPAWRAIYKGVNLLTDCEHCNKEVWVRPTTGGMVKTPGDGLGEDAGNLWVEEYMCPNPDCKQLVGLEKVKKIAMRDCQYQFRGRERKGGAQQHGWSAARRQEGGGYDVFEGDMKRYLTLYVHCQE